MTNALSAQEAGGGASGAAPVTTRVKHPNSRLISPLWLGEGCDGLSALYAAINGIRLALAHEHCFTGPEIHCLMRAGLRFFEGRASPQQCVLNGVRVQLWRGLVEAMVEATCQRTGIRLTSERIHVHEHRCRDAVFSGLDGSLEAFRVPLILLRGGIYTVVSGATPSSILLFDARGCCWISKAACGVPGDGEGMRHLIYPPSFVALNL